MKRRPVLKSCAWSGSSLWLFCLVAWGGAVDVDLSEYRREASLARPPSVSIRDPGFEQDAAGWSRKRGYSVDPTGGRNGTAGLAYRRIDSGQYAFTSTAVDLRPGARYRYGAWVRTEGVSTGKGVGASICLEFSRNGKWLSGDYPAGIKGTCDWTYIESNRIVPAQATTCRILLYLGREFTGKAWFDDVRVEPDVPRVELHVVHPPFRTITPEDGYTRINVYNEDVKTQTRELLVAVRATAGDTVKETVIPLKGRTAEADLSGLPLGAASVQLLLLDPRDRRILAETVCPLTVASGDRQIPANACLIDRRGRALVRGRPFLPVGLFMYILPKEDVDRIARGPFNCIVPYQSLSLSLRGRDDMMVPRERGDDTGLLYKPTLESVRRALDYCHEVNLKVIFSLHRVYRGMKWARTSWFGAEGETAVVTQAVTRFRDHPALLAWFVNDERPIEMMDRLNARRRLVNRLDPFHPTWAVLYQFPDLPFYGSSCDIIGVDAYPISNSGSRDMNCNARAMNAVDRGGLPAWVVPQIFNWGVYRAGGSSERFRTEFADPTEEQMRAMTLLHALRGAKGFVFYAYHDLKRPMGPNRFDTPPRTRADFERRWGEVCRIGTMLRRLEPFLLADHDAPAVTVDSETGTVQAREFRDGAGNVRIIVCGIGPGASSAVITTAAPKPLHSVYGRCTPMGAGKYRFSGVDICSDILAGADGR